MPGILRKKPRVAMIFAALTLLMAALAVSLPSLGFAKSAPEAAVSFNEGGGSPAVFCRPSYSATPEPTPTEKPGEPQNLSVVPGASNLTVTWDPPADGGAASGYNLEYRAARAGYEWVRVMANCAFTSVSIHHLKPYSYWVRVQAVNEIGPSGWVRQRTSGTAPPEPEPPPTEKPGEPQNLSVAAGSGSLIATWDPPADGGAASGYTVDYRPAGGSNWWNRVVYNLAATGVELTGLEPGVYLVRVRAINEIGASGWARQRTPKPTPPEPEEAPGRPRNLSVAAGSGSLTVTWDPPVSGGAASGYNVDYRLAGGGNRWVSVRSNAGVTSVEITGLEPDRYVVRVRAVNEIGESRRALKRVEVRP